MPIAVLFLLVASSALVADASSGFSDMAVNYLEKFGYIEPRKNGPASMLSQDALMDAVKEFQRFAGLEVTGRVDSQTARTMQLPRCGFPDKKGFGLRAQQWPSGYTLHGSKWPRKELSYRISKYPRSLGDHVAVDKEIARAFKVWSDVTPLSFTHKENGSVDIDIQFVPGDHGDMYPFDGPGYVLAHAYLPQNGSAHFDDQETWTINEDNGVNLFQVAAHEFGHSLGLLHSNVQGALMFPFYPGFERDFQLHRDDINGVQKLYGAVHRTPGKGSAKPAEGGSDLCQDAAIDAATTTEDGSSYVFKGDYYWKMEAEGIADGYPRRIEDDWGGLPGHIDAALTWSDGKTFFFKGNYYWRFRNKQVSEGYPKRISVGFKGIPDNVDAALVWSGNGKTYFFKGSKYWRYDSHSKVAISDRYPQPISKWKGLPDHLDAAFQSQDGYSYFFKGSHYYRFNDKDFAVDPAYPRATSVWSFNCNVMSRAMAQQQSRRHPQSATAYVLDRTMALVAQMLPTRAQRLQRDVATEAPVLAPVGLTDAPPPTTVAAGANSAALANGTVHF